MYFPKAGFYYSLNVEKIAQDSKYNNIFPLLLLCHNVQSFMIKVQKVSYKSFKQ